MRHPFPLALVTAALALTACERREEPTVAPATPTPTATASPTPVASDSPVASIIRPDALPGPIAELPPEPVRQAVPFAQSGSELSPDAERLLAEILETDAAGEGWPIILRGHSDSTGSDRANLDASRARAEAVAEWLVEQGVDAARIRVIAVGEQNPVAPNANPDGSPNDAGRARNRRVEVEIAPPAAPAARASDAPEPDTPDDEAA